jgi:hypothetical protein
MLLELLFSIKFWEVLGILVTMKKSVPRNMSKDDGVLENNECYSIFASDDMLLCLTALKPHGHDYIKCRKNATRSMRKV